MSNIRIQLLNIINRESPDSMNFIIAQYILENLERKKVVPQKSLRMNVKYQNHQLVGFVETWI